MTPYLVQSKENLSQKEQFKKQLKGPVICLVIKPLREFQKFQ